MLLTRSFYNPALLRSDLRRCWPLLGGYTLLWLLILPLHLWRILADEAPEFYQSTIQRILQGAVSASVWINLFAVSPSMRLEYAQNVVIGKNNPRKAAYKIK